MTRLALLLCLLLGASSLAAPQRAPRKKVAVLPFQAVSGDVPARAGPRLAARLASEIHGMAGLALAEPAVAPVPDAQADALTAAQAAVQEAVTARAARDFTRAESALGRALDAYAANAPHLQDGAALADTYALRAAVRYAVGRDEEAASALTHALAVAPGRSLPLAATSPLFAHTVERVRAAHATQPRGVLRFESFPQGLEVLLDGASAGTTPVRVAQVPPGAHLWRATLPSGEPVGGIVEALPEREVTTAIQPPGTGASASLALALSGNQLDASALQAATTLGREASADLVVFGTLSRSGTGLALDAFVFAPGDSTPRRLPRVAMDLELLDAGEPLRALAAQLASRGVEAGLPEAVPLSPTPGASRVTRPTQTVYAVPTSEPVKPAAPVPTRRPVDPIRKPLVRP
ncbi:PEGA domain-containing protein [Myxococcus qinghaiensis]|uniref:PEGA domain-containing protein n=1 Tax=Myxococcus qinghaiensis TaxID=2906758 RepID=UPI002115A4AB|nr:PEGA domain-containing protein [Myxococcus qinghaiensis]